MLDIRFPGQVESEAKEALMASMLAQKRGAMKRLQEEHDCPDTLVSRLLDIIQYHDLLLSHLEEQSRLPSLVRVCKVTLEDMKVAALPPNSNLDSDKESDSDDSEVDSGVGLDDANRLGTGFRLGFQNRN